MIENVAKYGRRAQRCQRQKEQMNNEIFQHAREAYGAKDYETALDAFTQCLQEHPESLQSGEAGLLYHQIGNCLVKLNDYNEAIHAYTQATADASYDACGTVNYNLGMAYAALHDYEDALQHFEIATSDAKYDASYKAYSSMGNAYLKLGKSAEAGAAFRSAALDDANPDPTKSLLNLGICFMALNRPLDAVSSYESALQFDMPSAIKNKLYANLGQAYVASGQTQKAASAFEEALADKTYFLSDSASVDYQRAVAAVAAGTSEIPPVELAADMSGLDVTADGSPVYPETDQYTATLDPYYYPDTYGADDGYASGGERFFNASDEELEKWSRGVAKQDRKRRNVGLKILVFIIVIALLVFGAGLFAYSQGYGYPMQETVVQQLFADKDAAAKTLFAKDLSADKVEGMIAPIQADNSIAVNGVDRSMTNSVVYVTAQTAEGGDVNYQISLVRDGIGWKVTNAELDFASQN
ncbi:MAG: tetratricopeptide repeat protein [Raoultibacter sp.]